MEARVLLPRVSVVSVRAWQVQESETGLLGSDQRADGREWIRAGQGQVKDAQLRGSKHHTAAAFLWLGTIQVASIEQKGHPQLS